MLLSKTAMVKWNSRNKKRLVDLGYHFTGMKNDVEVMVEDLSVGSCAEVLYECDYCHGTYKISWQKYLYKKNNSVISTDCCDNCIQEKAKESLLEKYGTTNIREIDEINEKRKNTNIERYGCDNPFGNKDVQKKIRNFYKENYGVEYGMQVPENVKKSQKTCMEKYGVKNYGIIWSSEHQGDNSPVWKGDGVLHERTERGLPEYRAWRKNVFSRDKYTCQKCGDHNYDGRGGTLRLEAHHIFDWKTNESLRMDVDNGITLCQSCHILFHSLYGKKGNNAEQLNEFLKKSDENIC